MWCERASHTATRTACCSLPLPPALRPARGTTAPASNKRLLTRRISVHATIHPPSYDKLQRHEEALADYTAAVALDPLNANAYHNRGSSLDKLRRCEEAVDDFTRAIEVAAREFAPDLFIITGPGTTLGGAVAQSLILADWKGMDSKDAFKARQADSPLLISMGMDEQRGSVT